MFALSTKVDRWMTDRRNYGSFLADLLGRQPPRD
jgi:hypothetical protein